MLRRLPTNEFDRVLASCDVGLIFLDYRFTIPNFPSRLLSYMQAGLPVLACTDLATDIGTVITNGRFGWWCESNDVYAFQKCVIEALNCEKNDLGLNGLNYAADNYSVKKLTQKIGE